MPRASTVPRSDASHCPTGPRIVALVAYPAVQMLDVAGPADVFAMANAFNVEPAYRVVPVSSQGGLVRASNGIAIDTESIASLAPATIDTLAGQVPVIFNNMLNAAPHVKSGKLRALGTTGLKRSPTTPDIPAIAETLPDYEQIVWHGVVAPARVPKPIHDKLVRELMRIIRLPDIQERLGSQGLDAVGSRPEELAKLIRHEIDLYAKLVKQIGFKPI